MRQGVRLQVHPSMPYGDARHFAPVQGTVQEMIEVALLEGLKVDLE